MRRRPASLHECNEPRTKWSQGDPISQHDWESVRELIYAGFGRRQVARRLKLHESLVGAIFDQLAPPRHPVVSEDVQDRIRKLVDSGTALPDIADEIGVSEASARTYVKAMGYEPRKLTRRYLAGHTKS